MSQDAICLEIELANQTKYYANTALHEDDTYWEPRLLECSDPTRSIDVETCYFDVTALTVVLDNADGELSSLLEEEPFTSATARLYYKTLNRDGEVTSSSLRMEGKCSPTGTEDQVRLELEILPVILTDLGYVQRTVDAAAFPNAPDGTTSGYPSTLGQGLPIVIGNCTAQRGRVKLVMVDGTANAEKLAVCSGWAYDVTAVFRLRSSEWTTLTQGTHYTWSNTTRYAVDDQSNPYSYIQLASGQWQEGDECFASVKGIIQEGYLTLDGTNDYLSRSNADLNDWPICTGDSFTIEAKVSLNTIESNQCLNFDGSTEYATVAHHSDFDITGDLTIEARVCPAASLGSYRHFVSKYVNVSGGKSYSLTQYSNTFRFILSTNGANDQIFQPTGFTLSAGTWYRTKVVYDASAQAISWYINGVSYGNTVVQGSVPSSIYSTSSEVSVGGVYGGYWPGRIDYAGIADAEYDNADPLVASKLRCILELRRRI